MFKNKDCMRKHREGKSFDCTYCVHPHFFEISQFNDLQIVDEEIREVVFSHRLWRSKEAEYLDTLSLIINEASLNAIEHGILELGRTEKCELLMEQENYQDLIVEKFNEQGANLLISLCINESRIALGFHDSGDGFVPNIKDLVLFSSIFAPNGRGLKILHNSASKISWNKDGNSVFCFMTSD